MDKIVFQGKSRKGRSLLIRYPQIGDLEAMHRYINTLSQECTFIRYQGETITLEEEREYLSGQFEKIGKRTSLQLLAFENSHLLGIADIEMDNFARAHVGIFGISIAREYRGEGIGTLLVEQLFQEAPTQLPSLQIIELYVFSNNPQAREMYKKFGFVEFGRLPKGIKTAQGYVDSILMYKENK